MTISEIKTRYSVNEEVIDRLTKMYKESNYEDNTIKEAIEKVSDDQRGLSNKIRAHVYKGLSKKSRNLLMKSTNDNDEIVLDKDSVIVTDVEEPKKDEDYVKVINITEIAPTEKEQLAINVQKENEKKEKQRQSIDLSGVKVIVDGDYKLVDKNNNVIFTDKSSDLLLAANVSNKSEIENDIICIMFRKFYNEYGINMYDEKVINLYDEYRNGNVKVTYIRDDIKKSNKKKAFKDTMEIAKRERKSGKNIEIVDNRFKKLKIGLGAIAAAGLMLAGSLGLNKITSKTRSDAKENTSIESVSDAGITDAFYETVNYQKSSMITEVPNIELDKEVIETEIVSKPVEIDKKEETKVIQVGDKFTLDSVDLYTSSTDLNPSGNTSHIEDSIYQVGLVSIVYENNVLRVIDDNSVDLEQLKSELEEKYGDSIEFRYNLNQLNKDGEQVTGQVGWSLEEQLESKGKVLKR